MSDTTETVNTDLAAKMAAKVAEFNATRKPGDARMASNGMIYGPGDVDEIISEPDYEKSLKISADIFGGVPEDYREPDMTQEKWAAIDPQGATEDTVPAYADFGPVTWPPTPGVRFFDSLDTLSPCCQATLGTATESVAVLEAELFRKAEDALDKAVVAAVEGNNAGIAEALAKVAEMYLVLAGEASS